MIGLVVLAGNGSLVFLSLLIVAACLAVRRIPRRMVGAFVFALVIAGGLGHQAVSAEDVTDDDVIYNCPRWPEMTEWERWICMVTGYCDCFGE